MDRGFLFACLSYINKLIIVYSKAADTVVVGSLADIAGSVADSFVVAGNLAGTADSAADSLVAGRLYAIF